MIQKMNDQVVAEKRSVLATADMRTKHHRKITFRDVATLYGERPCDRRVWHLSPYDFAAEWEVVMLSYPQSLADRDNPRHHAVLTPAGEATSREHPRRAPDLRPCYDYVVKEHGDDSWMPFPPGPSTDHFRHMWIIEKRPRLVAPMFIG